MGISSSRRRRRSRRMDSENETGRSSPGPSGNADASASDGERGGADLVTLLRFLVRSGNVSIISQNARDNDDDEDDDDEYDMYDNYVPLAASPPECCPNSVECEELKNSELRQTVLLESGQARQRVASLKSNATTPVPKLLQMREVGMRKTHCFTSGDRCFVASSYLPNTMEVKVNYAHKAFCGIYATSGDIFLTACQDRTLRIYDTTFGQFRRFKSIKARDVGWSVLDTAFSHDGNYLIYSSWSDYIHLVNIYGENETHNALAICPEIDHSFCVFSLTFSEDDTEIMCGANDGHIYVFDRDKNERTLRIDAHDDDVNTVRFNDSSSNILASGGDDGLVKVWDRRTLREEAPEPVGVLAGHSDGTTYIDSKGDGRYLISNSKDQTIKLWDMRKFSSESAQNETRRAVAGQHWDYRWQQPTGQRKHKKLQGDTSLMTYRGHSILHTLVRCRFSPQFSTGQRYIYTGCASGSVVIYDVLTGEVESRLKEHSACVRDVSWHPYDNNLISTSWDGKVGLWSYRDKNVSDDETSDDSDDDDDDSSDSDSGVKKRRSKRLKKKRKPKLKGLPMWRNFRHIIMD